MNKIVILFVEGETEKEFYESLFNYYSQNSDTKLTATIKVVNVKGIGRYETKVPSKLKNEILPKHKGKEAIVFCCYDTDVFELAEKPPTNWKTVKKKVEELDIKKFYEIAANRMIEDWFLLDTEGLCKFLKIKPISKIKGKDGLEKIKAIFKKGNKIYQKGSGCHKFVPLLNMATVRSKLKNQLSEFETAIGFKEKKSK